MNRNELEARYLRAKRDLFDRYYEKLNQQQREAVYTADGSLLVLAGAGCGKTTVLVNRIVYLIRYGNAYHSNYVPYDLTEEQVEALEAAKHFSCEQLEQILPAFISSPCAPWNMLAITFTNKAANEIKTRLVQALGDPEVAKSVWAGTFHSVCMRILRTYGDRLGYRAGFTVYDTTDAKNAVSAVMKKLDIDEKTMAVKTVMNAIGRAKDNLMDSDDFQRDGVYNDFRHNRIAKIYRAYQEQLQAANALDFDDIIMQTVKLLRQDEEVRQYYQKKFRYVCVDEFQDTNVAQFCLTELLAGGNNNVMVVGDDDQSIYKFRGAVIDNILGFDKKFSGTKVIRLEQNYRSTSMILDAANSVIAHNESRMGKELWTARKGGEKIVKRTCEDALAEARYVGDSICTMVANGTYTYRDMAILYRTNAQSRVIEQTFVRAGIPYRIFGGLRFNDRKEIRDLVAYLQLIVNPADRERFRRVVNVPKRAIGEKTVDAVIAIADEQNVPVMTVAADAGRYAALGRSAGKLSQFATLIASFTALLDTDITLEALIGQVLDRSGYRQMLIDGGEEEKERLENIEEFISGAIEYEKTAEEPSLTGFLEENSLVSEVDQYDAEADAVVMMTIHSAKGLEFPVVFLPGMEDGIFPGTQNIMSGDPADMEEERRLAYVAITRAKDRLYITRAKSRILYGRTVVYGFSRFADEIPAELLHEESADRYEPIPRVKTYYSEKEDHIETAKKLWAEQPTKPKPVKEMMCLREGDRVSHMTFGEGEILSVRPMGADVLYEVVFDRAGTKKLMGSYARLKKL